MFTVNDQLYYARRAAHAMALGNQVADPKIAAIHFELALRYSIAAVQSPRPKPDVPATVHEGTRRTYVSLEPVPEYALR